MKKVYVTIYLMIDKHGNKASATCEEPCDTVAVSGLKNKAGEQVYFESDAYHLDTFCKDNGITLKTIKAMLDFDNIYYTIPSSNDWREFELKEKE